MSRGKSTSSKDIFGHFYTDFFDKARRAVNKEMRPHFNLPASEEESIAHEGLIRIWTILPKFDPSQGSFTAWATGIIKHVALERKRAILRERFHCCPLDALETTDPACPNPSPYLTACNREREEAIQRAKQTLTDEEMTALSMKLDSPQKYQDELSKLLGRPKPEVASIAKRATDKIRRELTVGNSQLRWTPGDCKR